MNLWLVDGNDAVKAALIPIWRWVGSTNAVRGDAEYYAPGRDGMPVLTEQPVIFPTTAAPDSPNADVEPELKNVLTAVKLLHVMLLAEDNPPRRLGPANDALARLLNEKGVTDTFIEIVNIDLCFQPSLFPMSGEHGLVVGFQEGKQRIINIFKQRLQTAGNLCAHTGSAFHTIPNLSDLIVKVSDRSANYNKLTNAIIAWLSYTGINPNDVFPMGLMTFEWMIQTRCLRRLDTNHHKSEELSKLNACGSCGIYTRKKTLDNLAYRLVLRDATESIQQKHWTEAKEVLKASTSLQKFLRLANGNVSLVDLNESGDAWPDAAAQKSKSGPVRETRMSSRQRLRQTSDRTIAKIGIRSPLPMREQNDSFKYLP
ncbi:hypothetical protein CNMCM6805_002019 [Aspergillus fumigatiaffinis]|uniref:Uncharacterized protein n=1 Tax=Aspergillus fumigatiaffinis TaxID=340414 RepID=A0A8H4MFE4_9EURO|nr:hypothetical protein CNMCM5878_007561 [Aspergillus fumigatiaffinis]KAF4242911.1 hypothetical protein CNMCM6805_002019 [Aspergillus fumigatiaffinis]